MNNKTIKKRGISLCHQQSTCSTSFYVAKDNSQKHSNKNYSLNIKPQNLFDNISQKEEPHEIKHYQLLLQPINPLKVRFNYSSSNMMNQRIRGNQLDQQLNHLQKQLTHIKQVNPFQIRPQQNLIPQRQPIHYSNQILQKQPMQHRKSVLHIQSLSQRQSLEQQQVQHRQQIQHKKQMQYRQQMQQKKLMQQRLFQQKYIIQPVSSQQQHLKQQLIQQQIKQKLQVQKQFQNIQEYSVNHPENILKTITNKPLINQQISCLQPNNSQQLKNKDQPRSKYQQKNNYHHQFKHDIMLTSNKQIPKSINLYPSSKQNEKPKICKNNIKRQQIKVYQEQRDEKKQKEVEKTITINLIKSKEANNVQDSSTNTQKFCNSQAEMYQSKDNITNISDKSSKHLSQKIIDIENQQIKSKQRQVNFDKIRLIEKSILGIIRVCESNQLY